jgi:tRNA dimethylallyltransferase
MLNTDSSNDVFIVFGPTASGKTRLLNELFAERRSRFDLPEAEVVSADSMQVYKNFDIGTAKPDSGFLSILPHHLIDIRYAHEQFTVGDFVQLADQCIKEIIARGHLPVISGGTAFYLKTFIYGLPQTPKADEASRISVGRDLRERGLNALFDELKEKDPESARRIMHMDAYRITRALEVIRSTGRPLSSFRLPSAKRTTWNCIVVSIQRPREMLYKRIEDRVDEMFEAGLLSELIRLVQSGVKSTDPAFQAIGYKEFFESGDPKSDGGSGIYIEAVKTAIKRNSRRYAKRQITFFKSIPEVRNFDADDHEGIAFFLKEALARARTNRYTQTP